MTIILIILTISPRHYKYAAVPTIAAASFFFSAAQLDGAAPAKRMRSRPFQFSSHVASFSKHETGMRGFQRVGISFHGCACREAE